jgi:hypothetical protein
MQETNKGKRFEGFPQALARLSLVFTSNEGDYMRVGAARQGEAFRQSAAEGTMAGAEPMSVAGRRKHLHAMREEAAIGKPKGKSGAAIRRTKCKLRPIADPCVEGEASRPSRWSGFVLQRRQDRQTDLTHREQEIGCAKVHEDCGERPIRSG